jgi:hypothetical protein
MYGFILDRLVRILLYLFVGLDELNKEIQIQTQITDTIWAWLIYTLLGGQSSYSKQTFIYILFRW